MERAGFAEPPARRVAYPGLESVLPECYLSHPLTASAASGTFLSPIDGTHLTAGCCRRNMRLSTKLRKHLEGTHSPLVGSSAPCAPFTTTPPAKVFSCGLGDHFQDQLIALVAVPDEAGGGWFCGRLGWQGTDMPEAQFPPSAPTVRSPSRSAGAVQLPTLRDLRSPSTSKIAPSALR